MTRLPNLFIKQSLCKAAIIKQAKLKFLFLLLVAAVAQGASYDYPSTPVFAGPGFAASANCANLLQNVSKKVASVTKEFLYRGKKAGPTYTFLSNPKIPGKIKLSDMAKLKFSEFNMLNLIESPGRYQEINGVRKFISGRFDKSADQVRELVEMMNRLDSDILVGLEVESLSSMVKLDGMGIKGADFKLNIPGNDDRISIGVWINPLLDVDIKVQSMRELEHSYLGQTEKVFSRDFPVIMIYDAGANMETTEPRLIIFANHGKSQRTTPGSSDFESKIKRGLQAQVGADIVDYYAKLYPNARRMVTGDFNADLALAPELAPYRNMGMIDLFDHLKVPVGNPERATQSYFPRGGRPEYSQLDGILLDPRFVSSGAILDGGVVHYLDDRGRPMGLPTTFKMREAEASDHRPVSMVLNMKKLFEAAQ